MTERLVESLRGTGAIHASERLLRMAPYELSVWSADKPSASGTGTEPVTRINGRIEIAGIGEAVVLAGADALVLTIEDGRRLAFQLRSTDGAITAGRWLS